MSTALSPGVILDSIPALRKNLNGPVLQELRLLINNPEATVDAYYALLSPPNLVAMLLSAGEMPAGTPELIRREMEPLTELLRRELPTLVESVSFKRAAISAYQTLNPEETDEKQESSATRPRSIASLQTMHLLVGSDIPFFSVLRIVLQTNPPTADFEFYTSIEELTAICLGFIQNLAQMLEKRAPLFKEGMIKVNDASSIIGMVNDIEKNLYKIKELAPKFGGEEKSGIQENTQAQ